MMHIIHQLRMASGSNAKKRILEMYKHDDDWREVLLAMYDSSINYYVSAPRDMTFIDDDVDIDAMVNDLAQLSDRNYTGNAARDFALECSREYGEIFRLILGGSLKAGVSVTTLNAVMPGLIPEFKVMLAKDSDKVRYPVLASTKYDGVRIVAFVKNGIVTLKTRQGKILQVNSLQDSLKKAVDGVYDGELVSGDGKQAGRTSITGSVNKCLKGTATDIDGYTFCIFDFLPLEAWDRRQSTWQYVQRLSILHGQTYGPNVIVADQLRLDNAEQVEDMYQDHIERGYEGLILRSETDQYLWSRTTKLIKKKATNEVELCCVGIEEGKGKYEGMIGALVCQGKVRGKMVRVKLGSGLSDYDRSRDPSEFVGHKVDALYNDIVQAKGATDYSLFLPRFKRLKGAFDI
jgi:DNA ligase-1